GGGAPPRLRPAPPRLRRRPRPRGGAPPLPQQAPENLLPPLPCRALVGRDTCLPAQRGGGREAAGGAFSDPAAPKVVGECPLAAWRRHSPTRGEQDLPMRRAPPARVGEQDLPMRRAPPRTRGGARLA